MKYRQLLSSLGLAFTLLGANVVLAAENSADSAVENDAVIGKWNIPISFRGQSAVMVLTVAQGADGLEGTWAGPQRSTPIYDTSFDGENLKFTQTGRRGNAVPMTFKVAGDTISGKLTTPNGDILFNGKRAM